MKEIIPPPSNTNANHPNHKTGNLEHLDFHLQGMIPVFLGEAASQNSRTPPNLPKYRTSGKHLYDRKQNGRIRCGVFFVILCLTQAAVRKKHPPNSKFSGGNTNFLPLPELEVCVSHGLRIKWQTSS